MLSPWAVVRQPHVLHQSVMEQVGCQTLPCLQSLPLKVLMDVSIESNPYLPRYGPWFSSNPAEELERAGDTFVDRQLLLGLTSIESYCEFSAKHIESGLDLDEKDEIIRYSMYSLKFLNYFNNCPFLGCFTVVYS